MNPPTVYLFGKYELIHLSHVKREQSLKAFKENRRLSDTDGPHGVYFEGDKTLMKGQVVPQTHDFIRLPLDSFVIEHGSWSPPPPSSMPPHTNVWIPLHCFHTTTPIRLTKHVEMPVYGSLATPKDRDVFVGGRKLDLLDLGVSVMNGKVLGGLPDVVYDVFHRLQMPDGSFRWFFKKEITQK